MLGCVVVGSLHVQSTIGNAWHKNSSKVFAGFVRLSTGGRACRPDLAPGVGFAMDLHGAYDLSLCGIATKKICVMRSPPSSASCMLALRCRPAITQHVLDSFIPFIALTQ